MLRETNLATVKKWQFSLICQTDGHIVSDIIGISIHVYERQLGVKMSKNDQPFLRYTTIPSERYPRNHCITFWGKLICSKLKNDNFPSAVILVDILSMTSLEYLPWLQLFYLLILALWYQFSGNCDFKLPWQKSSLPGLSVCNFHFIVISR